MFVLTGVVYIFVRINHYRFTAYDNPKQGTHSDVSRNYVYPETLSTFISKSLQKHSKSQKLRPKVHLQPFC